MNPSIMKSFTTLLSALILSVTAFAQKNVTIFTAADDIARPITIKTGSGNYTLYNELRLDKHIPWYEAYDGDGNKIMQPGASKKKHYSTEDGSYLEIRYHFTTLYPRSGSSSSSSHSSSNSHISSSESIMGRVGRSAMAQSGIRMDGYPNFQLGVQFSTFFGESVTSKIELGGMGGCVLAAGFGKDLFRKEDEGEYSKKYGWFAGIGYYSGDKYNDFSLLVGYGSRQYDGGNLLYGSLEYTYFVTHRVGLLGGASLGIADKGLKLEAHLGLTFKILSN